MGLKKTLYNQLSDDLLLRRWAKGDMVASEVLVDRYYEKALLYCRSFLNRQESEDLVNDTFIRVIRKVETDSIKDFSKYLFSSLKTNFLRNHKKKKNRKRLFAENTAHNMETQDYSSFEFKDLRQHALAELSGKQVEVFSLYLDDYSYDEIMEKTGLSNGQIRGLIYRAKQRLKNWNDNGIL